MIQNIPRICGRKDVSYVYIRVQEESWATLSCRRLAVCPRRAFIPHPDLPKSLLSCLSPLFCNAFAPGTPPSAAYSQQRPRWVLGKRMFLHSAGSLVWESRINLLRMREWYISRKSRGICNISGKSDITKCDKRRWSWKNTPILWSYVHWVILILEFFEIRPTFRMNSNWHICVVNFYIIVDGSSWKKLSVNFFFVQLSIKYGPYSLYSM